MSKPIRISRPQTTCEFLELQKELSETETRDQFKQAVLQQHVRSFHNGCRVIPASIIAGIGGFKEEELISSR